MVEQVSLELAGLPRGVPPPPAPKGRVPLVFAAVAALSVVTLAATFIMGQVTLQATRKVLEIQSGIDDLRGTLSTLKDAETGQRGFLLTADEAYLAPYRAAVGRINLNLDALDARAKQGSLPAPDVQQLRKLIGIKLAELEQTLAAQRSGPAAALAIVRGGEGRRAMEDVRDHVATVISREHGELNAQADNARLLTYLRTSTFIATGIINLAFLAWALRRIGREIDAHHAATAEAERQRQTLAVTLASIGDAVVVTDTASRVLFMNSVAQNLTGWTLAEVRGRPLAEIFRIINEETRQPVESPVDKVLATGVIVGLANHTLLIRRDGSEIPIDDSGAPIRDATGASRGVVLVFRDFSDYKQNERKLREAKSEAEAANLAKDRFLATLSHELRTPLTPVLATLSAWESHPSAAAGAAAALPPELLADVKMLRRNVELEARLIDDLLDLTRIVKGKLPLHLEPCDVHDLLNAVARMYDVDVRAKRLRLTMRHDARRAHALADPGRLQQVFWNVLKNAVKFTPEGGTIEVRTEDAPDSGDGRIRVVIADGGIGMTGDTVSRLFRPFEQGTDQTVRRYGGLGLGLAITRALLDAQDGTITAASDGPGKGSTFTIDLPAAAAPAAPAGPAAPDLTAAARARAAAPARPLHILLVEDHPDTAAVMERILGRLGHRVTHADSATAARTHCADGQTFDLLISDLGLPDGTGFDVLQTFRAHPACADVPAIALTGYGMDEDVARCLAAGFKQHLTKPLDLHTLERTLHEIAGDGQ